MGVPADNLPGIGQFAGHAKLKAFGTLAIDQDRTRRVGRVGDRDIAAIQPIQRSRCREEAVDIPLRTHLEALELLRIQCLIAQR